jgi:hypothetical protein
MPQASRTSGLLSRLAALPKEAVIALAARSALRVFPIIGRPSATVGIGALTLADAAILQARFRAVSVAWFGSGIDEAFGVSEDRFTLLARSAAGVSLPIGTFATNAASSAAQRSAAQAVLAVANTGENSFNAVVQAVSESFLAEAESADDARVAWALDRDIEFLSGNDHPALGSLPLWLNHPPIWAVQKWEDLKATLHNTGQGWQVWTGWYDDRLDGRIRPFEQEMAYVNVPEEIRRQGPEAVNASIARRIEEYEPPPRPVEPVDPGGALGPRFSNRKGVEEWLAEKPTEWATVTAARAALRSIPVLNEAHEPTILAAFRAAAATWIAASIPEWRNNTDLSRGISASNVFSFPVGSGVPPEAIGPISRAIRAITSEQRLVRRLDAASAVAASADVAPDVENIVGANDVWRAVENDARVLEAGRPAGEAACDLLWPGGGNPQWVVRAWNRLKNQLLLLNVDWEVWTTWYEARLKGGPINQTLEIARVIIGDQIWQQGPRAVNAEIARLTQDHKRRGSEKSPTPEIGVDASDDLARWQLAVVDGPNLPMSDWADASVVFEQGSRTDLLQGGRLSAALEASDADSRIAHYISLFLTSEGAPRNNLISRRLADSHPELAERLKAEQDRVVGARLEAP